MENKGPSSEWELGCSSFPQDTMKGVELTTAEWLK